MPNPIIQVTNLSKSYTITHEGKECYTAFPILRPFGKLRAQDYGINAGCDGTKSKKNILVSNVIARSLPRCEVEYNELYCDKLAPLRGGI